MTTQRRLRFRFRFTISVLLFTVTVCAIALAYVATMRQRAHYRESCAAVIEGTGGWVRYDLKRIERAQPQHGSFLQAVRDTMGRSIYLQGPDQIIVGQSWETEILDPIREVMKVAPPKLRGSGITLPDAVSAFPEVTNIEIRHARITSEWATVFTRMHELEELVVDADEIHPQAWRAITELRSMRKLTIRSAYLSEQAMAELSHLKGLEELDIGSWWSIGEDNHACIFEEGGLKYLSGLEKLRDLRLRGANLTDSGMSDIVKCKSLESIDISATSVTEKGFFLLSQLNLLKTVTVVDSQVPDDWLDYFQRQNERIVVLREVIMSVGH